MLEVTYAVDGAEDQPRAEYHETQIEKHQRQQQRHHFLNPVEARGGDEST